MLQWGLTRWLIACTFIFSALFIPIDFFLSYKFELLFSAELYYHDGSFTDKLYKSRIIAAQVCLWIISIIIILRFLFKKPKPMLKRGD